MVSSIIMVILFLQHLWFADFMHRFPCPASITCYDEKEFIEQAWTLAGRKVSKNKKMFIKLLKIV